MVLERHPDLIEAHLLRKRWGLAEEEEPEIDEPTSPEEGPPFLLHRTGVSFADIGGMEEVKEQIRLMVLYPLQYPEIYQTYSRQAGGGIHCYTDLPAAARRCWRKPPPPRAGCLCSTWR
ncbi:MAG: hypothetical protein KatS3mg022_1991 [Armatimonadota bacterium]|nr:MAG: hypothetical protein KatS3mg022_1991 [Armatimonadota bacterium]